MAAISKLFKFLDIEDLIKAFAKAKRLETEAAEKSRRAQRLAIEQRKVLPTPEHYRAPSAVGEEPSVGSLGRAGPAVDISTKWPGRTPIMSSEGQKQLRYLLKMLGEEQGKGLEETRLVPMLERRPFQEPRQFSVTLEKAIELYSKSPEKYGFATTPTGGPPVHISKMRPGGGMEYQKFNIRSLVPELKREAAKMGEEVSGIEPPVRRAKLVRGPTKDDLAWDNVKTIPGESAWWRRVMSGSKGRFRGSTADFFKKQYYQYRTDPFGFVKKQGSDRMAQKFSVYKDLGLLP